VILLDIPGLGRFLTLICADLFHNDPGDWLLANMQVDWLHIPTMDKSICWRLSPARPPWSVRRAHRAVAALRTRVVATTSMPLSYWVNDENVRTKSRYGQYKACGVGLLLDGRGPAIKQNLLSADLKAPGTVVKSTSWSPAVWPAFPQPPFR
jgi:hypothetical protein